MRHRTALLAVVTVLLTTSLLPVAVAGPTLSTADSADDWPAPRGDSARTGANGADAPEGPNATVAREFPAGDDGPGEPTAPAVVDGTAFVGYDHTGSSLSYVSRGRVVAYDTSTGAVRWNQSNLPKIRQTPTVEDGRVYVSGRGPYDGGLGTPGTEPTARGGVFALDATTGEVLWARNDSEFDEVKTHVVGDGRVYVQREGTLVALNATTGETLWSRSAVSVEAVAASEDTLVTVWVNDTGTTVTGRNVTTGRVEWQSPVANTEAYVDPGGVAVEDGTVYVSDGRNVVSAIDADDGTVDWNVELASVAEGVPADSASAPAVENGTVYVGTIDAAVGTVHALDAATGTTEWRFERGDARMYAPTVADGTVYVPAEQWTASSTPSRQEGVYALDAVTGEQEWQFAQHAAQFGGLDSVETVPADGTLYLAVGEAERYSDDGGLYALRSTEEAVPPWNQFAADRTVSYPPEFTLSTDPPNAEEQDLAGGTTVRLTANATDPDGNVSAIEWDVGGDGEYERSGESITLSLDFCGTLLVEVKVTDDSGEIATKAIDLSTA
ncbi:PQQ-binding-like beta-propeller repeat protein [Halomicroarcula sp. F13]|uniref:PQQ-binding-like beta-propeller repeat protein n=1 Tax=Haloarcula rubra TaxID=2487747 RepID=A0AAW4PS26_9EURY|nr:PQQ-binding-like beta-propeller repeat protein [Halomicroarcula rubra]MBX0323793.1 PQQ-binding-like beta-propeller repeat protein [Halomicroarcula rubra]